MKMRKTHSKENKGRKLHSKVNKMRKLHSNVNKMKMRKLKLTYSMHAPTLRDATLFERKGTVNWLTIIRTARLGRDCHYFIKGCFFMFMNLVWRNFARRL